MFTRVTRIYYISAILLKNSSGLSIVSFIISFHRWNVDVLRCNRMSLRNKVRLSNLCLSASCSRRMDHGSQGHGSQVTHQRTFVEVSLITVGCCTEAFVIDEFME